MSDPMTEAGKRLLALHADCAPMTACTMHGDLAAAVVAIEAESRAHARRRRDILDQMVREAEERGAYDYEGVPADAVVVTEEALARALHLWKCVGLHDGPNVYDRQDAAAILAALREGER